MPAPAPPDDDGAGDAAPLLLPLDVERRLSTDDWAADGGGERPRSAAPTSAPPSPPRRAARCLCAAHALSAWVARMWEFSAGLALLDLTPGGSLTAVAVMGLAESAATAAAGPALGRFVDRTPRRAAAATLIGAQSLATLLSAGAVLGARALAARHPPAAFAAALAAALAASAAAVGAAGAALSVEREWPAALAGDDAAALASLNAVMRRIDLTCLIVAPGAAAWVMTRRAGPGAAVAAIAAAAALVWVPQLALLDAAQRSAPALRREKGGGGQGAAAAAASDARATTAASSLARWAAADAAPAAAALALLYCTVLSFGPLATAYLAWRGLPPLELAAWRGAGALAGLASTLVYPPLRAAVGLDAAGGAGLATQWACVCVGTVATFRAGVPPARALAAALAASRFGLWLFDQAAGQALQTRVPSNDLGAVNGVQAALQAGAGAASYGAGALVGGPGAFWVLACGSLAAVTAAGGVFGVGTARATSKSKNAAPVRVTVSLATGAVAGGRSPLPSPSAAAVAAAPASSTGGVGGDDGRVGGAASDGALAATALTPHPAPHTLNGAAGASAPEPLATLSPSPSPPPPSALRCAPSARAAASSASRRVATARASGGGASRGGPAATAAVAWRGASGEAGREAAPRGGG